MDSFQFWLYIIIAIIYVLSRAFKKKEPHPGDDIPDYEEKRSFPYESADSTSPKSGKPLTFEELLREITESKSKPQTSTSRPISSTLPPAQRTSEYVDYDDDIKDEEQDLEDTEYDYRRKDTLYDVYENAKKQAFLQPSLEETMQIGDTDMKFGRFKEFDQSRESTVLDEYVKELKDPDGIKKAFVLSEILNRKF